jgi:hypothetical protein
MVKLTGSLPKVGGLLDQDSYHMHLIQTTSIVLEEKRKQDEAKAKRKGAQQRGPVDA